MKLADAFSQLAAGTPRLLLCTEPRLTLLRSRRGPLSELDDGGRRVIVVIWHRLPALRQQIQSVLERFGELALAIYPQWNNSAGCRGNALWLAQAQSLCNAGRLPRVACPPAEQLHQLALVMGNDVVTLLVVDQVVQPAASLAALSRTAEWAARAIGGRLAVLVPTGLAGHEELSRIAYGTIHLEARTAPDLRFRKPVATAAEGSLHIESRSGTEEEACSVELWPGEGLPHVGSPGERLLALALAQAPDLRGRFIFNQPVFTVTGDRYRVDLLNRERGVVVEVDGYRYHSDAEAFAVDRQRDYALLISGYKVLRLTYHEVRFDLASALAKIRAVIAFAESRSN